MSSPSGIKTGILASLNTAQSVLDAFVAEDKCVNDIERCVDLITEAIQSGGKIISCGNGGSMCDAMHFAEELTGRFRGDRQSLPALSISDPSHITCTGNDFGFDAIFSRYVEGLGNPGDVLLVLSTSGNSPNIVEAVKAARNRKMHTIALLGKSGGALKDLVDLPIIVPAETSDRIQEVHIKIIHITIEMVEVKLGLG